MTSNLPQLQSVEPSQTLSSSRSCFGPGYPWYNCSMIPRLNKELSDALSGADTVEAIDPATGRHFVIIERSTFQLTQRTQVHDTIQRGLESVEAGGGIPLAEADAQLRKELDFPPRA